MEFLEAKRREIDDIDDKLVNLLEKRFFVVKEVVDWKKSQSLPIEDKAREEAIKSRYFNSSFPEGFSDKFFNSLFDEAKK